MLYDLNIPWSGTNTTGLQRTLSFLAELNYSVIALNHTISGAIPSQIVNPIPETFPFPLPKKIRLLRRCTLTISDPSLNHRLPALAIAYDILALRPTTATAFQAACSTLDHHSVISLDLTIRYPFHFRPTPLMTAVRRGIKFEICYSQAVLDTGGSSEKRRNFISNVLAIVRATRGRGLVVSSEAKSVLGVRAPADVTNLLGVWGVSRERAVEAATTAPRSVVVNEGITRSSFRGVIDVIDGGERVVNTGTVGTGWDGNGQKGKRKIIDGEKDEADKKPKMSKRQEKKLRLAASRTEKSASPFKNVISEDEIRNTPGTAKL